MLEGHAFVAEVLAELVDPLEAAHDEPLEVELGGDAEVEVAIERVVVRDERARRRAAVERLQHGRFDLEKARVVEASANACHHAGARDEALARRRVRHQIEVALAVSDLDVLQAMVAIRKRQAAGRELDPLGHLDAQLASTRAAGDAGDADQIANRHGAHLLEDVLTEPLEVGEELHPAGHVLEVDEGHAALTTAGEHAPSDAPLARTGLLVREPILSGAQRTDRVALAEAMRQGREVHLRAAYAREIAVISYLTVPFGVTTSTSSPFLPPKTARPIGDSFE